jgi:RNase P/RNase MRP subunit POP5
MPKRNPGERWRYIAFAIGSDCDVQRGDFLNALMTAARGTALGSTFRITVFEGNFGILKVPHTLKDEAIRVLRTVDRIKGAACSVDTLLTSGTIKTLKQKYRNRLDRSLNEWG